MNKKEREKFRRSKPWLELRAEVRLTCTKDYITKEPLTRTWNLHHLDLRVEHYDWLDDKNRFLPLNKTTHDFIHMLYKLWKKDRRVLDRIKEILIKMEEYTND